MAELHRGWIRIPTGRLLNPFSTCKRSNSRATSLHSNIEDKPSPIPRGNQSWQRCLNRLKIQQCMQILITERGGKASHPAISLCRCMFSVCLVTNLFNKTSCTSHNVLRRWSLHEFHETGEYTSQETKKIQTLTRVHLDLWSLYGKELGEETYKGGACPTWNLIVEATFNE